MFFVFLIAVNFSKLPATVGGGIFTLVVSLYALRGLAQRVEVDHPIARAINKIPELHPIFFRRKT